MVGCYEQSAVHVMVAARFPHQKLAQCVQTFADVTPLVEQSVSINVHVTSSGTLLNDAQRLSGTVHLRRHDNRLAVDAEARRRHDVLIASFESQQRELGPSLFRKLDSSLINTIRLSHVF